MEERLPATPPPMADIPRPHWDGFQATSELQIQSTFFGILPREVRDMIYAEFWEVSGPRQHILHKDDGHLTHFPCIIGEDEKDERNEMFGVLWREQQKRQPRSLVVNTEWAERMSSTWQQHWKCEEAMKGAANEGKVTGTLFLTSLLACKRMYLEALPSLYASTTFILTHLPTAHHFLVSHPTSSTPLIRSLSLSLSLSYNTLHYHRYASSAPSSPPLSPPANPHHWVELCTTLSNLVRFASLRAVDLRLDLADDRYWWEVRERWALSAIRGMLARCLTVRLPDVTVEKKVMQPYQFCEGDETLFRLERYPRLRWMDAGARAGTNGGGGGRAVQARLEFFNPREHVVLERETRLEKMRGLLRGWLI